MSVLWLALTLLTGCGGGGEGAGVSADACDLGFDTLEGRTFVMAEAQPDQTYKDNPMARVKFVKGENGLEAKYTAKSISDVYTYFCNDPKGEGEEREMYCAEKERPKDWCQALEVHEPGSCSRKALKKLGIEKTSDEDLLKAVKEARATVKEYRDKGEDSREWKNFQLNNNNLGNKLQGRLYVKMDTERCRLSLSDMYFTIHQGKKVEDTNPVGINPFVESDESFMFEHCDEGRNVVAGLKEEEPPEDLSTIPQVQEHSVGDKVNYFYLGEKANKAEEGCTYSADVWLSWKPGPTGIEVQPDEDGALWWKTSHTWTDDQVIDYAGKKVGLFEMVRYKTCGGGEKEKINTTCNLVLL